MLTFVWVTGACWSHEPPPKAEPAPTDRRTPVPLGDATNEDIAEVLLRHAFGFVQDSPARNTHYGSYCIAVFGKDPEPPFLRRFVDAKPLVRPLSDCRDTETGRRRDPEKKPAAIFEVHAGQRAIGRAVKATSLASVVWVDHGQ
jgi:hypothetical protein